MAPRLLPRLLFSARQRAAGGPPRVDTAVRQAGTRLALTAHPTSAEIMLPGPLRVLVVDDNVDFAVSFGQLLELLGCEVRVAHDTRTALTRAGVQRPQLVFLDLDLGAEHGSEVMSALRRMLHDEEGMTIVCLTGNSRPETEMMCRRAGFDLYLLKPIANDLLREVLEACRERIAGVQQARLVASGAVPPASLER
jgi:CheY-like chemotaxis protein